MRKDIPLSKLKPYGWNRRILTMDDFYRFCEAEGILPIERDCDVPGRYDVYLGQPRIRLTTRGSALQRLHVAWHEAGHHAFHTQGPYSHYGKIENEADCVADAALIPLPLLKKYSISDWMEGCGYPHWLVERRWGWYQMFGL